MAGRTTIDFTNEGDVVFFTPLLQEAMKGKNAKASGKVKAVKVVKADKDKKDMNSYMFFCEWARKNTEFPDKQPKEISRRLGEMWRALSDEEKAKYKQQADDNKRANEAARGESRAASPKRAVSPASDKPKKPLTSYIKFSNAMRDSVKGAVSNPQDVSRRLGEMWRALSDEEKATWKGDEPVSTEPSAVEKVEDDALPKKVKKGKKIVDEKDVEKALDALVESVAAAAAAEETPKKTKKVTKSEGAPKKSKKASDSE
jgi:hypothetical protein